jgi:hypothetical protein
LAGQIDAVVGVQLAVDPGEPDGGGEEGNGGDLFEDFHPRAGPGQQAHPGGLPAEQDVGSGEAEGEGGEDGEGDDGGLGEGESDGRAHERRGAWGGDDGGEDSGEEAAGVAVLLGGGAIDEGAADGGEREADIELAGEGECEEEEERGEDGDEDGGLKMESPADLAAGGA